MLTFLQEYVDNIFTYLRVPSVQRYSLAECTIRGIRRLERGRTDHLKLLLWRRHLRPVLP